MASTQLDALIVGAGFSGIYQLHRLRELGLSVKVVDMAGDVGGTWYWNRYPGAMSDTESFVYRFSWDKEDLQEYPWSRHYVKQPDVLRYLEHVVERHDLRKDMQFNTELVSADWDEDISQWHLELRHDGVIQHYTVRYLVTALGVLSTANYPDIPGIKDFQGKLCHTAAWDTSLDLRGKRVGIIGNGSTGVQVITAISKEVKQLVCFQRHPQYSVPSGDRPVEPSYRKEVNANYDAITDQVKNSTVGFGFVESETKFADVPPSDRDAIWQSLWNKGNGFRFMFGGFSDVATDRTANESACAFIRSKIDEIVTDKEKARKLKPYDMYARRPLCDGGYYASFNQPHVDIVSLAETPITSIVSNGIATSDGKVHELDVIIFATGFDAIEGSFNRVRIHGRGGKTLRDHWGPKGPTSYLGVSVPGFPNMLMILGPQGPFSNMPPAIEAHVELNTRLIKRAEDARRNPTTEDNATSNEAAVIECTPEAEKSWLAECEDEAKDSLFKQTASWIFGNNVPGKTIALRFYFGGLKKYYAAVERVMRNGLEGFVGLGGEERSNGTATNGDSDDTEKVEMAKRAVNGLNGVDLPAKKESHGVDKASALHVENAGAGRRVPEAVATT
jgi:cyclohexanone monooxygenase